MVEFDMYISPNFRGGQFFTTFSTSNVADLKYLMSKYWYRTGFSSATGEAFLCAKVIIDGAKIDVSLGDFVFDGDHKLIAKYAKGFNDDCDALWGRLGFSLNEYDDEFDIFEHLIKFLFDINSPQRVLGIWLRDVSDDYVDGSIEDDDFDGPTLLANILHFANQKEVLGQMYAWLLTKKAKKFLLSREEYQPASDVILQSLASLSDKGGATQQEISSFTLINYKDLGRQIKLND